MRWTCKRKHLPHLDENHANAVAELQNHVAVEGRGRALGVMHGWWEGLVGYGWTGRLIVM
jgi:hypothetical protein